MAYVAGFEGFQLAIGKREIFVGKPMSLDGPLSSLTSMVNWTADGAGAASEVTARAAKTAGRMD